MIKRTLYKMCAFATLMQFSSGCVSFKMDNPFSKNEKWDVTLTLGRSILNPHESDKCQSPAITFEFTTEPTTTRPLFKTPIQINPYQRPIYILQEPDDDAWLPVLLHNVLEKTF